MPINAPQAPEPVLSTLNSDGSRRRIRPKCSDGRFLTRRRLIAYGLLVLFVVLPFIEMGGRPAILLDLEEREFSFFGTTFLASDSAFLLFFGLSIVAAVLFVTALFGRVWCGWACPQTVYMEFIFRPIERFFEGTPAQQRKLDKAGLFTPRRLLKNVTFFVVAFIVANIFLAYFVGVERLSTWMLNSPAEHPGGFAVMGTVTVLMFVDFAWFREQTCIVACPYGRLQSVLVDERSLIVGYDYERGEPRGKPKKAQQADADQGDCIDCGACVYTCPTGIDIRKGLQMECIGCTQCIDACDAIMDRISKPRGLVRYTSQDELAGKGRRVLRARVVIYPLIMAAALTLLIMGLGNRDVVDIRVLRAEGTPYATLPSGEISNAVTLQLSNRTKTTQHYRVKLIEADNMRVIIPKSKVALEPQKTERLSFIIISPASAFREGSRTIRIAVSNDSGFSETIEHVVLGPRTQP